jgi:hypothetical protein
MNALSSFGLAVLACAAMSAAANAQIIPNTYGQGAPIIGGTYNMPPPPTAPVFGTGPDLIARQHKNPTGQPCVTISGFATPQLVNPTIFDHMLIVKNVCSQPVKLNVCYFKTTQCKKITIAGYRRTQEILGIMPNAKDFRFQYTEDFN